MSASSSVTEVLYCSRGISKLGRDFPSIGSMQQFHCFSIQWSFGAILWFHGSGGFHESGGCHPTDSMHWPCWVHTMFPLVQCDGSLPCSGSTGSRQWRLWPPLDPCHASFASMQCCHWIYALALFHAMIFLDLCDGVFGSRWIQAGTAKGSMGPTLCTGFTLGTVGPMQWLRQIHAVPLGLFH